MHGTQVSEAVLMSDERVAATSTLESGEPLVRLGPEFGPAGEHVRADVARRLTIVSSSLPSDVRLRVLAGHRSRHDLSHVPSHASGAAVDVTLVDKRGNELELGSSVYATIEESEGRCWFHADDLGPKARATREVLAAAMAAGGLVNYPATWWHWSYGDPYWAAVTVAPAAVYGPV